MSEEPERAEIFKSALDELSGRRGCDVALAAAAMTLAHYSAAASAGMARHNDMILIVPDEKEEANSADE